MFSSPSAPSDIDPKIKVAQYHLAELRRVLGDIQGYHDVASILQHINAAEELLRSNSPVRASVLFNWLMSELTAFWFPATKKSFSRLGQEDILRLGVQRGALFFDPIRTRNLVAGMSPRARMEAGVLRDRLLRIHSGVSPQVSHAIFMPKPPSG